MKANTLLQTCIILSLSAALCSCGRAQSAWPVRLNQVGFYPSGKKIAVARNAAAAPFYVIGQEKQDTVYRGVCSAASVWSPSGETVSRADFSALTTPGTYFVAVAGVGNSSPFTIDMYVHQGIAAGALKGFYYQRASTALEFQYAFMWKRSMGHPDKNVLVHPSAATTARPAGTVIASPRGWYDAGDYNKYIVNSGISTYTLLAACEHFPAYSAALKDNIPETGNGLPDVLNEALWNIRWMLTMQDPGDGGVYSKLTNPEFDGWIMPSAAAQTRYVVQKSTGAALDFAAVMAQASRVVAGYQANLPGLADSCLQASFNAWNWARRNPAVYYNQSQINKLYSPTINTGEYGDGSFDDEFAWAAAELAITTARDSFLTIATPLWITDATLPGWGDVRTLGLYSLALNAKRVAAFVDTQAVRDQLLTLANGLRTSYTASAYGVAMGGSNGNFVWGSNGVAANQGMALLIAYRLTGNRTYLEAAISNLDYLLGRNGTGCCFVTGFGTFSTRHPHHRVSQADGIAAPVPGLLAGGPNPGRQDGLSSYPSSMPALAYVDVVDSYASNEIAINWNAPLVYLAIGAEASMSPNGLPTGVPEHAAHQPVPRSAALVGNYPNPFNPLTTIEFMLPTSASVTLEIVTITGRCVRTLVRGTAGAGSHRIAWDATDETGTKVASGVYFCTLKGVGISPSARKLMIIR